jgi:hypothetical protein
MTKYTIVTLPDGEEVGRIEASDRSSAVSKFKLRYGAYGEWKGIRLMAYSPSQLAKLRHSKKNPGLTKDEWIPVHAVKFNSNGSVSMMTESGTQSNPRRRRIRR